MGIETLIWARDFIVLSFGKIEMLAISFLSELIEDSINLAPLP